MYQHEDLSSTVFNNRVCVSTVISCRPIIAFFLEISKLFWCSLKNVCWRYLWYHSIKAKKETDYRNQNKLENTFDCVICIGDSPGGPLNKRKQYSLTKDLDRTFSTPSGIHDFGLVLDSFIAGITK